MAIPAAPSRTMNPILNPKQPVCKLIADDGDVALIVKYVGAQPSYTVTVSAAGDITFKHGVSGSEAVDSTIQIGSGAGIIDVSNAAGNTFAEVVDHINGSTNWEAYLVDALRSDSSDASTGSLLEMTETRKAKGQELSLVKDTSKVLNISARIGSRVNLGGTEEISAAEIYQINSKNTFGSGTNLIQVYEIDEVAKTETKIYELAGGATTATDAKTFVVNGRGSLAVSKVGKHLLVRMIGSAACTGYLNPIAAVAK